MTSHYCVRSISTDPIHVCCHTVGSAIDVPLVKNPTKEQIVGLHEKYVRAVVDLYNKYKHKYSEFPEAEIKIV